MQSALDFSEYIDNDYGKKKILFVLDFMLDRMYTYVHVCRYVYIQIFM